MDNMTAFFGTMLGITADFLGRDPVIYVFGLVCLSMLFKVFRQLLP